MAAQVGSLSTTIMTTVFAPRSGGVRGGIYSPSLPSAGAIVGGDVAYAQGFGDGFVNGSGAGQQQAADLYYRDGLEDGFTAGSFTGIGEGENIIPPPVPLPSAPPVITIVTSLPPATANTPIVIRIVGANFTSGGVSYAIRRAWIDVVFPGILASEVIHNGTAFGLFYTNNTNSRVAYTDGLNRVGYQYTILRDGGWPSGSFPLVKSLEISAVDTIGNGT